MGMFVGSGGGERCEVVDDFGGVRDQATQFPLSDAGDLGPTPAANLPQQ
jgi:hypothetical protein